MRPRNEPDEATREAGFAEIEGAIGTPVEMLAADTRAIVREEIASLAGLMLNRLGNSGQPGAALMRSAWAEALADFSGHTGDGTEPGPRDDEPEAA